MQVCVQMTNHNQDPFICLDDESLLARRNLETTTVRGDIKELDFLDYPDFKFSLSGMHYEVVLA